MKTKKSACLFKPAEFIKDNAKSEYIFALEAQKMYHHKCNKDSGGWVQKWKKFNTTS